MPVAKQFLALCAVLLSFVAVLRSEPSAHRRYETESGEIGGAQYTWLRPSNWNQRVLLLAHRQRPESAPLTAELKPDDPVFSSLLEEGWLVATTSYRRNGLMLADSVADLDALRAEIVRRNGPLDRVIVEGDGMGAIVALLLAEREPDNPPLYQGVVAADPIFELRENGGNGITMQPKIPVVFLSTRREFHDAERYAATNVPKTVRPFTPALLRVNRDGAGNLNGVEKSFALQTLNRWIDDGRPEAERPDAAKAYIDATQVPDEKPSRVSFDADRHGFTAHVSAIAKPRGDLTIDAQPSDFSAIGIGTNAFFRVTIGRHIFHARFDKDESTLKRGEWTAFVDADGFYTLSRRQLSAAGFTQATLGDEVHIDAYTGPETTVPPSDNGETPAP